MQRVQGSTEQAKPLIVGKDTVYIHSNIVQIDEDLYEYDEIQINKDDYIATISDLLGSEQATTQYELQKALELVGLYGIDLESINMTMGEFVSHLNTGGTIYDLFTDIEVIKRLKKQETEIKLENYLINNPLVTNVHGDKVASYAVTFDKQSQMTMQFSKYQLQKQLVEMDAMSPEQNPLTWNAVGEMCEPWTEEEFVEFVAQVNTYIYPIVEYQRYLEKLIYARETKEEIMAIEINFDNYAEWWHGMLEASNNPFPTPTA